MSNVEMQIPQNVISDDIDDDDDQLNLSHKINTNIYKPTTTTSGTNETNNSNFNAESLIKNDVKLYLNTSVPKDYSSFVQCHIKREKEGLSKIFSLYFDGQNSNDKKSFLLIARKTLTIGGHSEYFIGTNEENGKNLNDQNSIGTLKGINIAGTEYLFYDHQNSTNNQNQSLAVIYDDHIFGAKGPRKLTVLLNDNANNNQTLKDNETIINQWRSGNGNNLSELKNQTPTYNEESKTYVINLYENRVKQPSHKNFQLVTSQTENENNVALQFGRIDENSFALDYRYPLTALQAFAIALTSFHNRFRT